MRLAAFQGEFALPKVITPAPPAAEAFADLGAAAAVGRVHREGVPSSIQDAIVPSTPGRDVLGRGRTGSGKTLACGPALPACTAGQCAVPRRPLALISSTSSGRAPWVNRRCSRSPSTGWWPSP
ncbi:hypothetical protein [Streptomyces clavifer]|uniref:hypothetical protein n=1 Tax=Streptomyces clavifer TaxID=68188 RepID=UPI003F4D4866